MRWLSLASVKVCVFGPNCVWHQIRGDHTCEDNQVVGCFHSEVDRGVPI